MMHSAYTTFCVAAVAVLALAQPGAISVGAALVAHPVHNVPKLSARAQCRDCRLPTTLRSSDTPRRKLKSMTEVGERATDRAVIP